MVSALLVVMITAQAQHTGYISNHKTITTELAEQYGIPSSVILAVALVESSSGESKTAKKLNNHFGIVGRNHMKTQGYHTKYKQYDNEKESFVDFCKTISSKNFYARLKDNADTKEWIKAISKAGYSEQPKVWEKKVLNVIEDNKL
jgi:flagellum-specific peptidoglycan hydrolase FlgJ